MSRYRLIPRHVTVIVRTLDTTPIDPMVDLMSQSFTVPGPTHGWVTEMDRTCTVVVPRVPAAVATVWHPPQDWPACVRGSFADEWQADQWARDHIPGHPYRIKWYPWVGYDPTAPCDAQGYVTAWDDYMPEGDE